MRHFEKLLFALIVTLAFSACYKNGGELMIVDNPPVVGPDTTVISYFVNMNVGDTKVPADTVYTNLLKDNQNGSTVGYAMDFTVAYLPTFSLYWESLNPNQTQIEDGHYKGLWAFMLNDTSMTKIEDWMLNGKDPNNFPQLDSMPFRSFLADYVSVDISEVVEAVHTDTLFSGEVLVVDRARVTLSGILIDTENGQAKPVSGSFICQFGRIE